LAQLIVRNLRDDIRDKLRRRAKAHGRSMEQEVREILRAATAGSFEPDDRTLGSRLMARFRGCNVEPNEIAEIRGHSVAPASFGR
jgi:antitoxin FitA